MKYLMKEIGSNFKFVEQFHVNQPTLIHVVKYTRHEELKKDICDVLMLCLYKEQK